MSKLKKNLRRSCYEIDFMVDFSLACINNGQLQEAIKLVKSIKKRTHKIKRTTWRGETVITKSKLCNTGSLTDWEKLCNKESA